MRIIRRNIVKIISNIILSLIDVVRLILIIRDRIYLNIKRPVVNVQLRFTSHFLTRHTIVVRNIILIIIKDLYDFISITHYC